MNIKHHLSDAFLLDYAGGNLSEGWSLAVATHLALCPTCRRQLEAMEGAAGALLEKMPVEANATDDSWERMKARLGGLQAIEIKPEPSREIAKPAILPEPLRSYVGGDLPDLKWRALGRGAYQIMIDTGDKDTQVRLLRIPAGKPVPEHTHEGCELTLVLAGSFRDGEDLFARGDIEEADDTLLHQPIATEGEDCICLAVTEASLKFTSWIVRLMQPILKI
ncbi:ChrR family anti-sigma-E factor [Rhizobium sp. XQZ8]|uniref:ChrR family anti-sigma-E factor n=1 Tax=Rhizobium populisoli TaxID=2859785 RepID=UPI001CA59959|nr:ChrR family anti-sigma-E factor [Rhizobium populisoli]MBW6424478.1 ChrR family anti-sigma-E factor [Rhizobium populisoli]